MAAAAATKSLANRPMAIGVRGGEHIFVYTHLRTHQTIYSLSDKLENNTALKQLTYCGKNSIPGKIRPDLWRPLCVLSFPKYQQGLDAYSKMREFKTLHETDWRNPDTTNNPMLKKEGPGAGVHLLDKKDRKYAIMNQRANTIADMAATLFMQAKPLTPAKAHELRQMHKMPIIVPSKGKLKGKRVPALIRPKRGLGSKPTPGMLDWQGSVEGVKIHWSDILDAEFAETWPEDVLHGQLEVRDHRPIWPPRGTVDSDFAREIIAAAEERGDVKSPPKLKVLPKKNGRERA